ncbi:MAG TPA: hypothetical protein DEP66_05000, partial [Acidimicrobiaceae bacterium]|nr:hypothetical protein [Acidimicrobiaceae bacterium]HCB37556.1 hypothetical protein [Acidimicrobiaceae bacterium]
DPPPPTPEQHAAVAALLGRSPQGDFRVKVTHADGAPVVIENAPFTNDGRPMPTRYWLIDRRLARAVARLEGRGGVRQAEQDVGAAELERLHRRYAAARDARIEPARPGPRPAGGVGGTRRGVKCLHAHLAHCLAGGDDVVGEWAAGRLTPADLT